MSLASQVGLPPGARDLLLIIAGILGMAVAVVHGFIMQRRIIGPLLARSPGHPSLAPSTVRFIVALLHVSTFSWFTGGLALAVAAPLLDGPGRAVLCALVGAAYLFAAALNGWASRGRHPGWALMALAFLLTALGS